MAFVGLGITRNEVNNLYEELGNNEKVITALIDRAAENNVTFPLKETVDTVLYELNSAMKAYVDWQPSKVQNFSFFIQIIMIFLNDLKYDYIAKQT